MKTNAMRFEAIVILALVGAAVRADTTCAPGSTPIPDGSGSVSRAIEIPAPSATSIITDVVVTVNVTHPWVGDLRLVLKHPTGAQIVLLDRPGIPSVGFPGPWGCGGANIAATFSDAATIDAETTCSTTATPVLAGSLKPFAPLSAFDGLAPQGTWTLEVIDEASIDAGMLGQVCLTLVTTQICSADLDANGVVDGADLAIVLGAWGACVNCNADIDVNGSVNGADLAIVLGAWGACQ